MIIVTIDTAIRQELQQDVERQVTLELGSALDATRTVAVEISRAEDAPLSHTDYICRINCENERRESFTYITRSRKHKVAVSDGIARLRRELVRRKTGMTRGYNYQEAS